MYGLTPRMHGNTKRVPKNTIDVETTMHVRSFIENDVEENAVILPGRIPGQKRDDISLLPSSQSKHNIWQFYVSCCSLASKKPVSYVTFTRLWNNYVIDEAVSTKKGANAVISYVHHLLSGTLWNRRDLFHADNCAGLFHCFILFYSNLTQQ